MSTSIERAPAPVAAAVATPRLVVIDALRGVAILAVVAYHFVWDLGNFGYLPGQWCSTPAGVLTGRIIAGSFLGLVGVSMALAHQHGFRARSFWRREAQLLATAALVTIVTFVVMPAEVVTFGILHNIALTSLLLVPFLRGSRALALGCALLAFALPSLVTIEAAPAWWTWTGLAAHPTPSLDYQPLLPLLGVSLLGLIAGRTLVSSPRLAVAVGRLGHDPVSRSLGRVGRHTLAIYLIHQPVMYGAFWLVQYLR
ncbi:DUF1624 domain-containing protein [Calidifontibacter sp. DB2511S]|nr:DUF1624 domain-containing protein [Calidifontibacter sp. DB2511S]